MVQERESFILTIILIKLCLTRAANLWRQRKQERRGQCGVRVPLATLPKIGTTCFRVKAVVSTFEVRGLMVGGFVGRKGGVSKITT
jgi:hypothetical protein